MSIINTRNHGSWIKTLQLLLLLLVIPELASAQVLESRLSQKADYVPVATSAKERLIEVAQHYRIPMGIEWINLPNADGSSPLTPQPTVREMILSIFRPIPGYKMEIRGGVVNVSNVAFVDDSRNFLSMRLAEYRADRENVFGAEFRLRLSIHSTLHPERYSLGGNGGYGYGTQRDDDFDVTNISFSRRNVTVREILNAIVRENGNALWVVELVPSKMMKSEPFFAQHSYGGDVQTDFTWRIIPLGPAVKQSN
jgi:hypothetical protein